MALQRMGSSSHANDYWTFTDGSDCNSSSSTSSTHGGFGLRQRSKDAAGTVDLWNDYTDIPERFGRPGHEFQNGAGCTEGHQSTTDPEGKCVYEDELFESRVHRIIKDNKAAATSGAKPLFIFWAPHIVHGPLQVPDANFNAFAKYIDPPNPQRQIYHSMVNYIDSAIGRVVEDLKQSDLYDNTVICFNADNGGPLPTGNNYPLKGGKFSNWEGGIRVNAFVSGGFLPAAARGSTVRGLMAGWDWLATWAHLGGVTDITDHKAAAAGLPPVDSLNMWPLISGANGTSPRTEIVIGSNVGGDEFGRTSGVTTVAALIRPPWKLILGEGPGDILDMAGHPGPQSPNATAVIWTNVTQVCGRTPETGCLYDVFADPTERHNVASEQPAVYNQMYAAILELNKTVYSPIRGTDDGTACEKAAGIYGGFWGPYLFLDEE